MPVCLAPGKTKQQSTVWALAENQSHQEFPTSGTGFLYNLQEAIGGRWGFNQRLGCTNLNI